ncbi:MAG: DUF1963 domain-containing protein [Sphingomonas sp.]|uniref:YwqG family protein n=1 Tax=Sphingomonas sp. TaxID=28214 RepID=UPI0025F3FE21|nr:DUF1963 domain-containing protein [Sphingomonas sp.]MBY0284632.1 DUF1963 domain-containing protein [Sphingomonas sp.]
MIEFLRRLLGGPPHPGPATVEPIPAGNTKKPVKPPIPDIELAEFKTWFLQQTRPALALMPDASAAIAASGSRLCGPAWLAEGETWPSDAQGVPLEFLAQLDCAECQELDGYPESGIIQFFIGRGDLHGADFDDPTRATMLVRRCDVTAPGSLIPPPPLEIVAGVEFSDFSPFQDDAVRSAGIGLRPTLIVDRIDQSIMAAEKRITALYQHYTIDALEAFLESDAAARPLRHQTGGYPAYTQSDVHYQLAFADFDHVLLRLTSDELVMWGDVGECVFLIRSSDLARADFSRVAYSWDCH